MGIVRKDRKIAYFPFHIVYLIFSFGKKNINYMMLRTDLCFIILNSALNICTICMTLFSMFIDSSRKNKM